MSSEASSASFKFFGGRVCLDFANSLNWRLTDAPVEMIPDYLTFLGWSTDRGTLSGRAVDALRRRSAACGAEAEAVLGDALRLRANLINAATALRDGRCPDTKPMDRALAGLPPQPTLRIARQRFVFDLDGSDLRQPLWPILWSFTAVLASSDADRIGSCQAEGCGWFFVDESPNRSRLWCSDICGNRERVRRSYAKRCTRRDRVEAHRS